MLYTWRMEYNIVHLVDGILTRVKRGIQHKEIQGGEEIKWIKLKKMQGGEKYLLCSLSWNEFIVEGPSWSNLRSEFNF